MHTVSVALATYNGGRHLRAQLDSISRQTRLPAELVICDDGSSDDTLEIARAFAAEAPYKVVIDAHGLRLGYSANFIRAVHRCTGEIVALCDQDDRWDERKLEAACAEFHDERVTALVHRIRVVDERLAPTGTVLPSADLGGKHTLFDLPPHYTPNGMQLLFRRVPITPLLDEPPPLSLWGDRPTNFDETIFYLGTLTGSVVLLNDILSVWRRHDTSSTGDLNHTETTYSPVHHLKLGLNSGNAVFVHLANMNESRARFAERAVPAPDGGMVAVAPGAAEFFWRLAETYRRRARLHGPQSGFLARLQTFGAMLRRRDHRPKRRGGLGGKSLLKDLAAVFLGRA